MDRQTTTTARVEPGAGKRHPSAPLLLRIDGLFEATLGILLLLSQATSLVRWLILPGPARGGILTGIALLLVALLPILWWLSSIPRRGVMGLIAAGNGAGAILFACWVLIWHGAFPSGAAVFVLVVAGMLALLAALQAWSASRLPSTPS